MPRYRGDQFRAHLSVHGVDLDNQSWDSFAGGDMEPQMEEFVPGGMGDQVAMGGVRKRKPITLERAWDTALIGDFLKLDGGAGQAPFTLAVVTLNKDGSNNVGKTTYTGVLGKVTPPPRKNDDSKTAMLTVELSCDGPIHHD